jgi:hypothetical protein
MTNSFPDPLHILRHRSPHRHRPRPNHQLHLRLASKALRSGRHTSIADDSPGDGEAVSNGEAQTQSQSRGTTDDRWIFVSEPS